MAVYKGAVQRYAETYLGGPVVPHERVITLAAGAQEIYGPNPERVLALLVNTQASEVYLGWSSQVTVNQGIILQPNGGFLKLDVVDDFTLLTYPLWLYVAAGGGDVYLIELIRAYEAEGQ